jgi:radical SAM protein with 4Fe4S-binding SPASM domain
MSRELFLKIVAAVAPYKPKSVALNHYGEPLLDPHFRERCLAMRDHNLPLMLFTNGTQLSSEMSTFILHDCLLRAVVFNYPSARPAEWSHFMQLPERFHAIVTAAIRKIASDSNQTVEIFVNGVTECQKRRTAEVSELFQSFPNVRVLCFMSDDRAGAQKRLVSITEPMCATHLSGCDRILRYIHFRYDGAVYLCCQDYEQQHLLGNIGSQSVAEIMTGEIAQTFRRQIYGMEQAPQDFICRSCSRMRYSRLMSASG